MFDWYVWFGGAVIALSAGYAFASMYLAHARDERYLSHLERSDMAFNARLMRYVDAQQHLLFSENTWKEGRLVADDKTPSTPKGG